MQVELHVKQMRQLARLVGSKVNNPVVESTGCCMLVDMTSLVNFAAEGVGFGDTWHVNWIVTTSSGGVATADKDYLAGSPVNKSDWAAPLVAAIGTLPNWSVPALVSDTPVSNQGAKPIYTFTYNGPSNTWMNIEQLKPDGVSDNIKFSVGSNGVMIIEGTDEYGPFGTVAQVPC